MEHASTTQHGFTLGVLVIAGVALASVAAVAMPHFSTTARDARVEQVDAMAAVIRHTADSVHLACLVDPRCNVRNDSQFIVIQGQYERVNHGWLDATHAMNNGEIDAFVHHNGFTASQPDASRARFTLDDAPEPAQCGVTYLDATQRGGHKGVLVSKSVDGC